MDLPPAYAPQALCDILPIYHTNDASARVHSYTLRQVSPDSQTLTHTSEDYRQNISPELVYNIKTFKTGGFMNRKPHIIISSSQRCSKSPIAEARFDIHGTGTSIAYGQAMTVQRLELAESRSQLLRTTIHGIEHCWQPFAGNKDVLEMTNQDGQIVARFVHVDSSSPRSLSMAGDRTDRIRKKFPETDVGELHVVDALVGGTETRMEIVCSAIVVVERAKRRKMLLSSKAGAYGAMGSFSSSVAYIPQ